MCVFVYISQKDGHSDEHNHGDSSESVYDHEYNEVHQYDNRIQTPETGVTTTTITTNNNANITPATDGPVITESMDTERPSPIQRSRASTAMIVDKDFTEGFSLKNTDQPTVFDVMKVGRLTHPSFLKKKY